MTNPSPKRGLVHTLLLALALAGCDSARPVAQAETPKPTPIIVYVTPAPTSTPRVTPVPEPIGVDGFDAFMEHVATSTEEWQPYLQDLTEGSDPGPTSLLLARLLSDEVDWLLLNPAPDGACYESSYAEYLAGTEYLRDGMQALADGNELAAEARFSLAHPFLQSVLDGLEGVVEKCQSGSRNGPVTSSRLS